MRPLNKVEIAITVCFLTHPHPHPHILLLFCLYDVIFLYCDIYRVVFLWISGFFFLRTFSADLYVLVFLFIDFINKICLITIIPGVFPVLVGPVLVESFPLLLAFHSERTAPYSYIPHSSKSLTVSTLFLQ